MDLSAPAASHDRAALLAEASALRTALEEQQRQKQGPPSIWPGLKSTSLLPWNNSPPQRRSMRATIAGGTSGPFRMLTRDSASSPTYEHASTTTGSTTPSARTTTTATCTQRLPSAFTSPYDDDTYGTLLEFGTRAGGKQTIKSSFYFKDDTHREGNVGEPTRSFRDQSFSVGLEDTVRLSQKASAIFGFSADRLQVLNAENFAAGAVTPFPKRDIWA